MTRRTGDPRLAVIALFLLGICVREATAHVGGHPVAPGMSLALWTEPGTGAQVPGTLLFVRRAHVHVEGIAGERHVWAIDDLTSADQARARAFLAHRRPLGDPDDGVATPGTLLLVVWPAVWLLAAVVACTSWLKPVLPRLPLRRLALLPALVLAAMSCSGSDARSVTAPTPVPATPAPSQPASSSLAPYFAAFAPRVQTREDGTYLYVESDGLAAHTMMVGIRSWQQQVPLPAAYTGTNAWRLPLAPRLAAQPVSARTGLFRGAIALAVNGVPIFNALNNRGDDAYLAGELDDYGGHAGRADDYHYHTAPLFLSAQVGATRPIGVALDGFLLYGALEPDGSPLQALDDYNGHVDAARGYHYHGTRTYPYINGGMKGEVQVTDQVEPQPSVRAVRPALTPLAGATVTRHESTGATSWRLDYQVAGRTFRIDYRIEGARVIFVFIDPDGTTRTESYAR